MDIYRKSCFTSLPLPSSHNCLCDRGLPDMVLHRLHSWTKEKGGKKAPFQTILKKKQQSNIVVIVFWLDLNDSTPQVQMAHCFHNVWMSGMLSTGLDSCDGVLDSEWSLLWGSVTGLSCGYYRWGSFVDTEKRREPIHRVAPEHPHEQTLPDNGHGNVSRCS